MQKAAVARSLGYNASAFATITNLEWFKDLNVTFAQEQPRPFADPKAKAALIADFEAGMLTNHELAKKYGCSVVSIKSYHSHWANPRQSPDGISRAQLVREAQTRRDAELAAALRRERLLATGGSRHALAEFRLIPEYRMTKDGRHIVTIAALQEEYDRERQRRPVTSATEKRGGV